MNKKNAYTLIEILVVIGVVAILTAIIVVVINPTLQRNRAKDSVAVKSVGDLAANLEIFKSVTGRYPQDADINALSQYVNDGYVVYLASPGIIGFKNKSVETGATNGSIFWDVADSCLETESIEKPGEYINWTPAQPATRSTTNCGGANMLSAIDSSTGPTSTDIANEGVVNPPVGNEFGAANRPRYMALYYKMDESSGSTLIDSSGRNNTGTLINSPTRVTNAGVSGNAIGLNGINQYASAPASSTLNITGALTLSVWVKRTSAVTAYDSVVSKVKSGNQKQYMIDISGNKFRFGDEGGVIRTSTSVVDGTWYNVVGVYNGTPSFSGLSIYLNGAKQTSATNAGIFNGLEGDAVGAFYIGQKGSSVEYFKGKIDEVKVYNYALSDSEISSGASLAAGPNAVPTCTVTLPTLAQGYGFPDQTYNYTINAVDDDPVTYISDVDRPHCGVFTSARDIPNPVFQSSNDMTGEVCTVTSKVKDSYNQEGSCTSIITMQNHVAGRYRFEEGFGITLNNTNNNVNYGNIAIGKLIGASYSTNVGTPQNSNHSLRFQGSSISPQYASIPDHLKYNLPNPTIAFLFKISNSKPISSLLSKGGGGSAPGEIFIYADDADGDGISDIYLKYRKANCTTPFTPPASDPCITGFKMLSAYENVWYLVAVSGPTGPYNWDLTGNDRPFILGADSRAATYDASNNVTGGLTNYLDGFIDDFRIYDVALNANQKVWLYQSANLP